MEDIKARITAGLGSNENSELFYRSSRRMKIKAFKGQIADLTSSEDKYVSARVIDAGRMGTGFTERITDGDIANLISQARTNAQFVGEDPGNQLYRKPETGDWDGRKGDLSSLDIDEKKQRILAAEQAALDYDPRIVNVPYCDYEEREASSAVANSFGLEKSQAEGFCYFFVGVMAKDGDETQTGFEYAAGASPSDIDFDQVAREAAQAALDKLGAREIDSGEFAVVFDADAASELLSAFIASPASPFYGENIQKGRSMLAGKLGTRIGSELFSINDDPQSGLVPRYFDGDGVETRPAKLVDKGVFKTVVHNLYSAAREEGAETTGHGSRSKAGVGTALHAPVLEPGSGSLDDLLAKMGQGILVTEVEGLHAGLNPVTGDFSLSAKGFMIEDGKRAYPVRNMVAAGNFFQLAENLSAVAGDARKISLEPLNAPSIFLSRISISGK
jgi:PmbA protein